MAETKSILITGCSTGGIGDAVALAFHRRGHKVIATARDLSKVKHLEELGISIVRLDVLDEVSIQEAAMVVSGVVDGKLDILVNNAGVGYAIPILDVDLAPARKVFDTNFFGRVAITQALAPLLIAAKGTIVNIGSISGINPTPWSGMYNACCAAVHMWSDTLRLELSPFGVRVVLVITGGIETQFLNNLPVKHLPPDSLYLPEKEVIESTMFGAAAAGNHLPAERYAELLVDNALKRSPKKHQWAGKLTTELWLVSRFLWSTAWDYLLPGPFGITALKEKLEQGRDKA